ncbi:MAG: ester cyclase [Thaumarchaeota archaeon]|nr:MAG: ester cyclase [Nitrososphaerota archaeon]
MLFSSALQELKRRFLQVLLSREIIIRAHSYIIYNDLVSPTYRSVNIRSAGLYRIENGIIIEHWYVVDQLNLLQQTLQKLTLPFEILLKEQ